MHEFENVFQKSIFLETIFRHFWRRNWTKQIADNVRASHAEATPDAIRLYFENLKISLNGVQYNCIFNYDETNLTVNRDSKMVILLCYYYSSGHKALLKHTKNIHVKSETSYVYSVYVECSMGNLYLFFPSTKLMEQLH